MGIYTRIEFSATLKKDTPQPLIDYLKYRLTNTRIEKKYLDDKPFDNHPFFTHAERWDWVLTWHTCNGHESKAHVEERPEGLYIFVDSELKNYHNTIEWFLVWIAPMVNLDYDCQMLKKTESCDWQNDYLEDCSDLIRSIQKRIQLEPDTGQAFLKLQNEFGTNL